MSAATRAVTWLRYDDLGAEYAEITLDGGRLRARSTAVHVSRPGPRREPRRSLRGTRPDGEEFVQDIVFDRDGIVLDPPEIARRIG